MSYYVKSFSVYYILHGSSAERLGISSTPYFELKVESYRALGYNETESRERAIKFCMEKFDISYKEVALDE